MMILNYTNIFPSNNRGCSVSYVFLMNTYASYIHKVTHALNCFTSCICTSFAYHTVKGIHKMSVKITRIYASGIIKITIANNKRQLMQYCQITVQTLMLIWYYLYHINVYSYNFCLNLVLLLSF